MNTLSISSLSWSPFTNLLRHKGCSHKHIIGELSKTSFWEGVKTKRVSKHIWPYISPPPPAPLVTNIARLSCFNVKTNCFI